MLSLFGKTKECKTSCDEWLLDLGHVRRTWTIQEKWCKSLRPWLTNRSVISTKWVFKNKYDEFDSVVRNKVWLVTKGYT